MINYIKDAVTAVSGIKTFLFNTDYRNNFDLQHVEFPCCVLTPIMRTNYDLKNIIRESAELQLSVVDLAPYEYTGDELYAINKRCSDLALQVIANLQVKSKLDKELTFEFILPSGDELISGVMCNLQCTMKQGSCIGKPSYVEVIVQPIKRENITRNGKHVISPSKGFTAMREVEVDVFVPVPTTEEKSVEITHNGEVEILPTSADAMTKVTANIQVPPPPLEEKQVTITRNGTTEIVPTSEYGLSRVEVVADVAPNLQDKQVTITENGTTTITADEGFEGLNSVEVMSEVYEGFDFSDRGMKDFSDRLNAYFLEDIDKKIISTIDFPTNGIISSKFYQNLNLVALDLSKYKPTQIQALCYECYNLKYAKLNTDDCTNLNSPFRYCWSVEYIELTSIAKNTQVYSGAIPNIFWRCDLLKELYFTEWKQYDVRLYDSLQLKPKSIHYIIQNAMSVADGAVARKLHLNATAASNWKASEYYEEDLAVLEEKGITIVYS